MSEMQNEQLQMHIDEVGNKYWRLHGKLHRDGAPAIEYANGTKLWYQHDELHRDNGPAVERANGDKMWYLHNNKYGAKHWAKKVLEMHNKPCDEDDANEFLRTILIKSQMSLL
jgi:hypothetical protein